MCCIPRLSRSGSRHTAAALVLYVFVYAAPLSGEEYVLTRREAVQLGTARSIELETAAQLLAVRRRKYRLSLRNYLPRLELGLSFDDSVTVGGPDSRSKRVTASLIQPLYNGGVFQFSRNIEESEIRIDQYRLSLQRTSLADTIWDACSEILILERKYEIQKKLLSLSETELSVYGARQKLGIVSELELVERELQAQSMKITAAETEIQLTAAYHKLKSLLELPAGAGLRIADAIESGYRGIDLKTPPDSYVQLARRNNPELILNRYSLNKEEKAAALAKKNRLPAVSVEAAVFVEGEKLPLQIPGFSIQFHIDFSHPSHPGKLTGSIGKTGPRRASRGFHIQSSPLENVSAATEQMERNINLRLQRKQARQLEADVAFAAEQTIGRYRRQQKKVELAAEFLTLQRKKLDILKERLQNGTVRQHTCIEAEIEYCTGEINVLEEIFVLMKNERQIEQLLGLSPGGLSNLNRDNRGEAL